MIDKSGKEMDEFTFVRCFLHDKHAIDARVVFDISSLAMPPRNWSSTVVLEELWEL
jgi:hypothetical protein